MRSDQNPAISKRGGVPLLCTALIVALTVSACMWNPEPSYRGRSLSKWIAIWDQLYFGSIGAPASPNSPELAEAEAAIHHIGPKALPLLLAWLQCERPEWKNKILEAVYKLPGRPFGPITPINPILGCVVEDRQRLAICAFRVLGPDAAPAVPELGGLMHHPNQTVSNGAIGALSFIGQQGLPPFISSVTNLSLPFYNRRLAAANIGALTNRNVDVRPAIPALIQALKDPDPGVQVVASKTLKQIAPTVLTNAPPR